MFHIIIRQSKGTALGRKKCATTLHLLRHILVSIENNLKASAKLEPIASKTSGANQKRVVCKIFAGVARLREQNGHVSNRRKVHGVYVS